MIDRRARRGECFEYEGQVVRFLGFVLTILASFLALVTIIILQYKVCSKHRLLPFEFSFSKKCLYTVNSKCERSDLKMRVGNASESDEKSFFERAYHNDLQANRLQILTEQKGA